MRALVRERKSLYPRKSPLSGRGAAGTMPPPGAVPCCDPDPVTGHWPHWLECNFRNTADNWHLAAFFNAGGFNLKCGTYEAIGPHFQNNPFRLTHDILARHGSEVIRDCPRSFGGLRDYLESHPIEGIVFWIDGEPMCKIKRSDFGFRWPCENAKPIGNVVGGARWPVWRSGARAVRRRVAGRSIRRSELVFSGADNRISRTTNTVMPS